MAVTYMNSSTLSEALDQHNIEFTVGSTANISVGSILVVNREQMKVAAIPISGRVNVRRGVNGTAARPHLSGSKFWIAATPDVLKSNRETMAAIVGTVTNLPDAVLPGVRARDERGSEFICVDLTEHTYSGCLVAISNDGAYTATHAIGGEAQGAVGIMAEEATSDQWAWCQIYGYNAAAQFSGWTSAGTSPTSVYIPVVATTNSSPPTNLSGVSLQAVSLTAFAAAYVINGMFFVGPLTTAVTSATSNTGAQIPVFLNYPYVRNVIDLTSAS